MKLEQTQGGAFKRVPLSVTELAKIKEFECYEAREYLANTDWYYARLAETGEAVPDAVKARRIKAREILREAQDEQ